MRIIERSSEGVCCGNAGVPFAVFHKKNSEKQRQNSGHPAVISAVRTPKVQDFRQK
jgi:hypothetical protein